MEMGRAVSGVWRDRSLCLEQGARNFQLPRVRRWRHDRHGAPLARIELRRGGRVHRRIIRAAEARADPAPAAKPTRSDDKTLRIERARKIWGESVEPRGTIVERYLAGRELDLGENRKPSDPVSSFTRMA